MKNKILKMLDNKIIVNIVRTFILCLPIILWYIACIISSKI